MENVGNLFLRNRIVSTLNEINELNRKLIDRDITKIESGVDFDTIFNKRELDELTITLEEKKFELNLLIACSLYGFEKALGDFLEKAKDELDEKEYEDLSKLVNELKEICEKDIQIVGGVAN